MKFFPDMRGADGHRTRIGNRLINRIPFPVYAKAGKLRWFGVWRFVNGGTYMQPIKMWRVS